METPSPVIKDGPRWFALPTDYELNHEVIEQLCALRRSEQQEMRDYMETEACLMQFLSRTLDDPHAEPCGRCANCTGTPLLPEDVSSELANAAGIFLRRSHRPIRPRKKWPLKGALSEYGFSGFISKDLISEEGRALSQWGDAGWGQMVIEGKYRDKRFDKKLIEGCVQMIDGWAPHPEPSWVTCVPSLSRPELVQDFASGLADRLGLPFVPCVQKVKDNRPQKKMENSFQQAGNLDGVFEIGDEDIPDEPVFLVDDVVDSGWTMTIIGALLRQAGCPAVFPLALSLSTHSFRDR